MIKLRDLRTENFVLRKLKNSDKEDLLSMLLNDLAVKKYIPGLVFNNIEDVEKLLIISNLHNSLLLVIEDISSRKIIGMIFAYINSSRFASISYVMHSNHRGKGIMPEALKLFIKYLYEHKRASSISFYVKDTNKSSIRVMQKLNIPIQNDHFHLSLIEELPF